jgi:Cu/Ag efflux protein CusF
MRVSSLKILLAGATLSATLFGSAFAQGHDMKMDGMKGHDMGMMATCDDMAPGYGVINSIDADGRTLNMTHDPIEKLGWGAMTMDFQVADTVDLDKISAGTNVHFMLKEEGTSQTIAMLMPFKGDRATFKKSMMESMKSGDMMMCDSKSQGGDTHSMSHGDHHGTDH